MIACLRQGTTAMRENGVDAPSYGRRDVAHPVLARLRALELRREGGRQELDLEHDFFARSRGSAVRAERRTQQGLVDQEVERDGRLCGYANGSAQRSSRRDVCC